MIVTLIAGFLDETKRERFQQFLKEKCELLVNHITSHKEKRLPYLVFKGMYRNLLHLDPVRSPDTFARSAAFIEIFMSQFTYKQLPGFIENCLYKCVMVISNKQPGVFAHTL